MKPLKSIDTRPAFSRVVNDGPASDRKEFIIIMGGYDEHGIGCSLKSTHFYYIGEDAWTKGPDMNMARDFTVACVKGRFTYILFGKTKKHHHD